MNTPKRRACCDTWEGLDAGGVFFDDASRLPKFKDLDGPVMRYCPFCATRLKPLSPGQLEALDAAKARRRGLYDEYLLCQKAGNRAGLARGLHCLREYQKPIPLPA